MFQRSRKVWFSAPVTFHAASPVSLPSIRGGVLDAPRSRDRRAALGAPVRLDQPRPRHPRRSRLASTTQRIQSRGHSPRTILYGRTEAVLHLTPGGRGSPPLRRVQTCKRTGPETGPFAPKRLRAFRGVFSRASLRRVFCRRVSAGSRPPRPFPCGRRR